MSEKGRQEGREFFVCMSTFLCSLFSCMSCLLVSVFLIVDVVISLTFTI